MFSKAERAMETWTERGLITPAGKSFLTAVLDPFHDSQLTDLSGWPDIETSPSLVRQIKQSITINKSPLLPAGNWDFMVVLWPWMRETPFWKTETRNNNVLGASGATQPIGGLQVFQIPSGQDFDLNDNVNLVQSGIIELPLDVLTGSNRLIGAGFELHDTTAQIAKQGAVCSFNMHNVPRDASIFTTDMVISGGTAITRAFNGTSFRSPPRNTKEALLIPGSVEWNASDGVYAVARFAGVDNPPYTVDYNLPVLFEFDDVPGPAGTNTSSVMYPAPTVPTSVMPAMKCFPVHTSGCIVTGQADTCTFRLNFNCFLENFPGPRDTKDLSIARPSASFDPRALEIYSHVLGSAPVAVPVGENPLGEWFMDVVKGIGDFLTPIGGIPGALGQAATLMHKGIMPYMNQPAVKAKPAKQKQIKAQPQGTVSVKAWDKAARSQKAVKTFKADVWQRMTPQQRADAKKIYTVQIVPSRK